MIVLKDNKVNRDCLLLYIYVSKCGGLLFRDLRDAVASGLLVGFDSNLVYCLRKLREYKCIDVIVNRNTNGKFDESFVEPLFAPILERKICNSCGLDVKKSRKAKHQNLCLHCTKLQFMSTKALK